MRYSRRRLNDNEIYLKKIMKALAVKATANQPTKAYPDQGPINWIIRLDLNLKMYQQDCNSSGVHRNVFGRNPKQ